MTLSQTKDGPGTMSDGFDVLVKEANAFFAELSKNNTKDWFEPRKAYYVDHIKKPAELFTDLISEDVSRKTGQSVTGKVFRIYRDTRFSKDKTPYNTHLHILWSVPNTDRPLPAWFFGCAPDEFLVGLGVMSLSGDALTRYRAFIDTWGDDTRAALEHIAENAEGSLSDFGAPPLKRVPKPYDANHPHADLLKRKGLVVTAPMPQDWAETGLVAAVNRRIDDLMPLWTLLHDHL